MFVSGMKFFDQYLRYGYIALAAILLTTSTAQAVTYEYDLTRESAEIARKVKLLFEKKKWKDLEVMAKQFRDNKEVLSCGEAKLAHFYRGIHIEALMGRSMNETQWLSARKSFEAWRAFAPESITAATAEMSFMIAYAWEARGDGYAHEIKDGETFMDRIQIAHDFYNEVIAHYQKQNKPIDCPGFYTAMLTVARVAPGWSVERADRELLQPALTLNPRYIDACVMFLVMIEPKWGGNENDNYKFYDSLTTRIPGPVGEELYARILVHQQGLAVNSYRPELVNWELMKRGNLHAVKSFPNSIYLVSSFLKFSYRYGEQEPILNVYKKEVPALMEKFFKSTAHGRAYQYQDMEKSSLTKVTSFKPKYILGVDQICTISVDPVNEIYGIACSWRGMQILRLGSQEPVFVENNNQEYIGAAVFSPDRKYFFTAACRNYVQGKEKHRPFRIYSNENGNLTLLREHFVPIGEIDYVSNAVFTPDSKRLLITNLTGVPKNKGKERSAIHYWDWKVQDSKPVKFYTNNNDLFGYRFIMDDSSKSFYISNSNLMRFDLTDLSKPPELLFDDAKPRNYIIDNFVLFPDRKRAILVIEEKAKYSIVWLDLSTRKPLQRFPLEPRVGQPAYIEFFTNSTGQGGLMAGSDFVSGALMSWQCSFKDDVLKLEFDATLTTIGQPTRSMASFVAKDGERYIITGTENGMIGIYRVKAERLK